MITDGILWDEIERLSKSTSSGYSRESLAHVYDEQRKNVLSLLEMAKFMANDLHKDNLSCLIERALDECQASLVSRQAPYTPD